MIASARVRRRRRTVLMHRVAVGLRVAGFVMIATSLVWCAAVGVASIAVGEWLA